MINTISTLMIADIGSFTGELIPDGSSLQGAFTALETEALSSRTKVDAKEPKITVGASNAFWRGDKVWTVISKQDVGLSNVDNTSDVNKPISSAVQTALNLKASTALVTTTVSGLMAFGDKSKLDGIAAGATLNDTDANLRNRTNHTGTQAIATVTGLQTALDGKAGLSGAAFVGSVTIDGSVVETRAQRGVANGYAALGADGKVPSINLPDNGSYKGNWDASTNTPTITAGSGTNGDTYTVSVAGTQSITGTSTAFSVGDQVRFTTNGSKWERIPNAQAVASVAGLTGAIPSTALKTQLLLVKNDVGLGNVDNTSDVSKPISAATQTALDGKEANVVTGTTAQYYRGDKSWQTLNKAAVGLTNVDNTSDANKPVSTATTSAIAASAATLQPLNSGLTAIAALTTTTFGRTFLTLADAAASRTQMGLGTAATANTGTTGGSIPFLNGTNFWGGSQNFATQTVVDAASPTPFIISRNNNSVNASLEVRTTAGSIFVGNKDGSTLAIKGNNNLSSGANWMELSSTMATFVGVTTSTLNATGGTITGITDLAVADGGTGASNAAAARSNLGLGNVDNTTDASKPVSTPQAAAINTAVSGGAGVMAFGDSTAYAAGSIGKALRFVTTIAGLQAACALGGEWFVAPGTYVFGNIVLRPVSGTKLIGVPGKTIFTKTATVNYRTAAFIDVKDVTNIMVEGITFTITGGSRQFAFIARATAQDTCSRIIFRNNIMNSCYFYCQRYVKDIWYESNQLFGLGGVGATNTGFSCGSYVDEVSGERINADGQVTNVYITNNYFADVSGEAIDINTNTWNIVIANNTMYNCAIGGGDEVIDIGGGYTPDTNCRHVTITGNNIYNNDTLASGTRNGIRIKDRTEDVTVTGNVIIWESNPPPTVGTGFKIEFCKNVTITGNTITGFGFGITATDRDLNYPEDLVVVGNVFSNNSLGAALIEGKRIKFDNNLIDGTGSTTFAIDIRQVYDGGSISGNQINNSGATSIRIQSDSPGLMVQGNQITDSGNHGMEIYGEATTVTDNIVKGSAYHGIHVAGVAYARITNNRCYNNGRVNNTGVGFSISTGCTNFVVTGNSAYDNQATATQARGFSFGVSDGGTFANNFMSGNRLSATTGLTNVTNLTQSVTSVSGLVGAVTATDLKTAIALNNVDNTSDANKPVSTAQLTALNQRFLTFATRANFVSALSSLSTTPVGLVVSAGGFTYVKDGTSSSITDLPGWKPFEKPSFAHFGGDLTGTNDVATQIQACLNAYGECYIPADGVKHRVTTVAAIGWIRGTPGKSFLRMVGSDVPFKMYGTTGTSNALNGVVGIGTRDVSVFSPTTDLVAGQWMIIEADTPPIPNMNSSGTAEIVQIESVNGQVIRLMQPLAFNYPSGVSRGIRRINWARNCGIEGVDIQGSYTAFVTSSIPGLPIIDFRFCEAPVVRNCQLHDHNYAAINFMACHAHKVSDNYIHDLMSADDDVNGGFGYGVQEQAVTLGGVISGNTVERCRNGYTTGAGHASVYKFGVPMNTVVIGNTMSSMLQSGCSTHEAGYYISFIGNAINGCRAMGINIRAVGHIVQDNTITNTTGAGIMVVSSPSGDVRDTIIKGNTLIRTNQGVVPQGGETHANIGAINSNGPDVIITDNVIKYPGGQGIRFNYVQQGVVRNNVVVNPCQSPDCTIKWAIGATVAGGTGHYVVIGGNTIISNDGKMTKPINNPGTFTFHDGAGNVAPGYTISLTP